MSLGLGLSAARAALGVCLLVRPQPLLRVFAGRQPDEGSVIYARVLGARHLVEAALTARSSTGRAFQRGAAVDAVHAVSAGWLAEHSRRRGRTQHHRLAALNCVGAIMFAVAGARTARSFR